MGVYTVVWRGPRYMRVIPLSLDTKTYRGTQLLLYQCVHFLKPLAFTDASIETCAPYSVEQTAVGASGHGCCVHSSSCNGFHWEAQYVGQRECVLWLGLTSNDSIVGRLVNRAIKLDDVTVAEDTEDFSLTHEEKTWSQYKLGDASMLTPPQSPDKREIWCLQRHGVC